MIWVCAGCLRKGHGIIPGGFKCPDCGSSSIVAQGGPPDTPLPPPPPVVEAARVPVPELREATLRLSEVWSQVDRMSKIECCHAQPGKTCLRYHAQGTPVVHGYEGLSKGVMGAVYAARNDGLDEAIMGVSELATKDAMILKSHVLEILQALKLRSVR